MTGRPRTLDAAGEAAVARMWKDGVAAAEIAERTGLSESAVYRAVDRLGLDRVRKPMLPKAADGAAVAADVARLAAALAARDAAATDAAMATLLTTRDGVIGAVLTLFRDGVTAREIGRLTGRTRNAVLGIVHRARGAGVDVTAPARPKPARAEKLPRAAKPARAATSTAPAGGAPRAATAKAAKPARPVKPARAWAGPEGAPIATVGVGLLDLRAESCRWPLHDELPALFCGAARLAPHPYCVGHCRLAYRPPAEDGAVKRGRPAGPARRAA